MRMYRSALFVLTLAALVTLAQAGWVQTGTGSAGAVPEFAVQSTDANTWTITATVPGVTLESVTIDGETFDAVTLPGEATSGEVGEAILPHLTRLIALESSGDPTVEVVSEEWTTLDGSYELERHLEEAETRALDDRYMTRDEYLPAQAVTVTPRHVLGGVSLAQVRINAVKYNPASRSVRVLQSIEVRVVENGLPINPFRPITETTAQLLRPIVPNWDDRHLDEVVVRGSYLFVIAEHDSVPDEIAPLVEWREKRGHTVLVAGPNQISGGDSLTTSNVKNYIQGLYDTADPPLEYVCLVGDAGGTFYVPCYTSGGAGDWEYTLLEGGDPLSDVALGRLSFSTTTDLKVQINKIVSYETNPSEPDVMQLVNPAYNSNWYKAAGCVAASASSGISTVQISRTVRARLLDADYISEDIDTLYYIHSQATETNMELSLNSGVSVWTYRGWMNMTNWSNADDLENVGAWPFIVNLTCGTNDFGSAGYDESEDLMVPSSATPTAPTGAIGVFGMSSSATHTRYNNILMNAAVQGLCTEGIHGAGAVLIRARLGLYNSYFPQDASHVTDFSHYSALLGDPALDIRTDTPEQLYTNAPASMAIGTNTLTVTVTNSGAQPVEGAYVNLLKDGEVFTGDWTNAGGQVTLHFPPTGAGTLYVTATKHNHAPALDNGTVSQVTHHVAPSSSVYTLDDDQSGTSSGNDDGVANPGETIELPMQLKNWGTANADGVTATLSSSDPFVASISDPTESFGSIPAPNGTAWSGDDFDFTVASYVPDGHVLELTLTVSDLALQTYVSSVAIPVANGDFEYVSHTLLGDGVLDPNETGQQIYVTMVNDGSATVPDNAPATLVSNHPEVSVTDAGGTFPETVPGAQSNNNSNRFTVSASEDAFPGERIPMTVIFPLTDGFADTVDFWLTIGSIASDAPTPPDEYGYWAFDDTDTDYEKAPVYDWVELDPAHGGSGTNIGIVDDADEADASAVVSLPFSFSYYGEFFNEITICSNGWLAMGADQVVHQDFRNYAIPSAVGPSRMIAPFWDDLRVDPTPTAAMTLAGETPKQELARIETEIDAHKAINSYDAVLWERYYELRVELGLDPPRVGGGSSLDQGTETCTGATVISSLPYSDTGTTAGYANDYDEECPYGGSTAPDVAYQFTPAADTVIQITTCNGSDYDTKLYVYEGTCASPYVACNDDADPSCGGFRSLIPCFEVTGGLTYYIIVDGYSNNSGNYVLDVTACEPPPERRCCYGDPLTPLCTVEAQTACEARPDFISWDEDVYDCTTPCPPCIVDYTVSAPGSWNNTTCSAGNDCNLRGSEEHIYAVTIPYAGEWTFSLCGSLFDTYMYLGTTCCRQELGYDDDGCGTSTQSEIPCEYLAAGTYYVAIECFYSDQCGEYTLSVIECIPPEPAGIFTQHDAANHRFIIEWSRVWKYNLSTSPTQTFECILYEPGYPETPTGDGEILFQYQTVLNTGDVGSSNDYATVGIENLTKTDGVMYSYWDKVSPDIPGGAGLDSSRAILFTTDKIPGGPPPEPAAPTGLVVIRDGNDVDLYWDEVTQDIYGSPITVDGYKVYGGATPDVTPATGTLLGSTPTPDFEDSGAVSRDIHFYVVEAYVN